MEKQKYIIFSILIFISTYSAPGQNRKTIYDSFINNDMNRWKQSIDLWQNAYPEDKFQQMELINFQYGYIAWCIGNKKKEEAEKYLDLAEKNIEKAEKQGISKSIISSYKSAFYGFRIGLNFAKAPFLGPKSIEKAKEAMKEDPANPNGHIQYANAKYYMPTTFGGSKHIALDHYIRAEKIMEADFENLKYNWNYINLLVVIAQAYTEIDRLHLAKNYYEKTLKIEPGFLWVKDKLYPDLLKKIQKTHE